VAGLVLRIDIGITGVKVIALVLVDAQERLLRLTRLSIRIA